jgi:exodeoxyribonuclease V alpha subunit
MFALQAGGLRAVSPARLPPHESVFAMTVHKSQGSEFERVGLLLPPQLSPILTRELIYTGITRARSHVTLFGNAEVLRSAIELRVERASGLTDALWGVDGAR